MARTFQLKQRHPGEMREHFLLNLCNFCTAKFCTCDDGDVEVLEKVDECTKQNKSIPEMLHERALRRVG